MSTATVEARPMRIGELARAVGTTPRTIRYYEEIGLLPGSSGRPSGGHRVYSESDLEQLRELMRLKDLLGVSLDELRELVAAEEARTLLRREFHESDDPERRTAILEEALGHIDSQLELVRRRKAELEKLESELTTRRRQVRRRLAS